MTASTFTRTRAHAAWVAPHADLLAAALQALRAVIADARWAVWRWYQVHQTSRRVSNLSDYLLKDIGLARTTLFAATARRVREEEAIRRGGAW